MSDASEAGGIYKVAPMEQNTKICAKDGSLRCQVVSFSGKAQCDYKALIGKVAQASVSQRTISA